MSSPPTKLIRVKASNGSSVTLPQPKIKGYELGQLLGHGTYGYVFRSKKIVIT